jgi:type II secretory pathway pseudopilin PulG
MVVIVIIGIIAAIAIAYFQDVQRKSRLSADQATTSSLVSAVAIYYGRTNGSFPPSTADLSTLVQPAPVWNCSQTIQYTPTNGRLVNIATLADC